MNKITKIFEYLGAARPVLALGPKGDVIDELLQETQAGVMVDNVQDMIKVLKNWITEYCKTGHISYRGNRRLIAKKYTRREQARDLAKYLDLLVKNN